MKRKIKIISDIFFVVGGCLVVLVLGGCVVSARYSNGGSHLYSGPLQTEEQTAVIYGQSGPGRMEVSLEQVRGQENFIFIYGIKSYLLPGEYELGFHYSDGSYYASPDATYKITVDAGQKYYIRHWINSYNDTHIQDIRFWIEDENGRLVGKLVQ